MSSPQTPTPTRRINLLVVLAVAASAALLVGLFVLLATRNTDAGPTNTAFAGHHMEPSHVVARAHRGELKVLVGDYWFKPSARRLHAGVYRFTAKNDGVIQHDVMIERTPIKFSAPGAPIDEAAPYGIDDLQPSTTKSAKIMLDAGQWELFCSVPGHYQSGQHERITVYGHMPRGMKLPKAMDMDEGATGMGDAD